MAAYYNENDPYAAQWLRNLIGAGQIADGVVDERSIEDILPNDLREFTQCHFFAGIGVWSLALRRIGWSDDRPIWTGSCPCQPFSAAGKGKRFDDERHLWPAWYHLITQCRPATIIGEQVANALPWLDLVSSDLESADYAFAASDLCAAGFEGAHVRQRIYFIGLAESRGEGRGEVRTNRSGGREGSGAAGMDERPSDGHLISGAYTPMLGRTPVDWLYCRDGKWRAVEPGTFPLANEAAARVGRLRAYGNAIDLETATRFCQAALNWG